MENYLIPLAKVAGLCSAGVFAGYTWALSDATVPAILDYGSDAEDSMLEQWRYQYIKGAAFSRPCCIINAFSFGYLAYHTTQTISGATIPLRLLYVIAALSSASGVPWALTALRRTNGALSIRSKRILGPFESPSGQPMCITYASHESASLARERDDPNYTSTKALVMRWKWHNDLRTIVLVLGAAIGAFAVVLDQ